MLRRELPGLEEAVPLAPLCAYGVGGPAEFLYRAATTGALVHAVKTGARRRRAASPSSAARPTCSSATPVCPASPCSRATRRTRSTASCSRSRPARSCPAWSPTSPGRASPASSSPATSPGSVGGAVVGNAGAYGRAVSDVLVSVHLLDGVTEHVKEPPRARVRLPHEPLQAAARPHRPLRRPSASPAASARALLDEIARDAELRRSKHPLEYASCGSYFKNPSRELPAARLIEDAGLKGFTPGRRRVSEKHANFLVALPGATAADIVALAAEVKRRVREQSGYELVEEVRRLGFE